MAAFRAIARLRYLLPCTHACTHTLLVLTRIRTRPRRRQFVVIAVESPPSVPAVHPQLQFRQKIQKPAPLPQLARDAYLNTKRSSPQWFSPLRARQRRGFEPRARKGHPFFFSFCTLALRDPPVMDRGVHATSPSTPATVAADPHGRDTEPCALREKRPRGLPVVSLFF